MSNLIEKAQILWRKKESRGPDVELILPLPVAVAVETKNTFGQALEDLDQIIGYQATKKYDAVVLRVERLIEEEKNPLKLVLDQATKLGIGVVVGGYSYSPLMGTEKVLARAHLDLISDPGKLAKEMGRALQKLELSLDKLLSFRKFFEVSSCG
jgi:hypothetical protein